MTPDTKRQQSAGMAAVGTEPALVIESSPEYRDWAGLLPELLLKIGNHLLEDDLAEYIRMRAVCKPWQDSTQDPIMLEPRFCPRNWLLLAGELLRDDGEPERFLNVRTGAVLRISIVENPREWTHHGNAEGILLLHHAPTDKLYLINPLTQAFKFLPTMASICWVAQPCHANDPYERFFPEDIKAVGLVMDSDEMGRQLSCPTIVLSLAAGDCTKLVCVQFGGDDWVPLEFMNCGCEEEDEDLPLIQGGGLSVRGRFYVATYAGDVLTVELNRWPEFRYVARMTGDLVRTGFKERSYLMPSLDTTDSGMLLVRVHGSDGNLRCTRFAVDLNNESLSMQKPSGVTVFLPSVALRCSAFPKMRQNAIYLKQYMYRLLQGNYIPSTARRA